MIGQDKYVSVFVRNDPVGLYDPIGLMASPPAPAPPPPPSTDPCVEAQKKLKIYADEAGALVCHNGKTLGCVWNKEQGKYKQHPNILRCAQIHEDEHVKQHPDNVCEPCQTHHYPIDPKKKPKDECDAYGVELGCLKEGQKSECGTAYDPDKDPGELSDCEKDYWMAITNVESQKKKYCKTGEGKKTLGLVGALVGDDL